MKPRVKTEVIAVRIEPELKERAEELAAMERRTMSSWLEVLIAEKVAASAPTRRKRAPVTSSRPHRAA
jgi:predicted transcriptional regulator